MHPPGGGRVHRTLRCNTSVRGGVIPGATACILLLALVAGASAGGLILLVNYYIYVAIYENKKKKNSTLLHSWERFENYKNGAS